MTPRTIRGRSGQAATPFLAAAVLLLTATSAVTAIGGNLHIESLQDESHYDSKQRNTGASLTVGTNGVAGSVNLAKSDIESDYASVTEQFGIRAGDGGFNVTVKGDTTLIGAVITSTDKAATEGKQIETEHTIGIVVLIANVSGH
ncbi:MAG: hemagglutinin repeat-containing protein [Gammaproteobacteria bacterium]